MFKTSITAVSLAIAAFSFVQPASAGGTWFNGKSVNGGAFNGYGWNGNKLNGAASDTQFFAIDAIVIPAAKSE